MSTVTKVIAAARLSRVLPAVAFPVICDGRLPVVDETVEVAGTVVVDSTKIEVILRTLVLEVVVELVD